MALLWCDGFDHYGTDTSVMLDGPYEQVDSVFSLSSSNPRTGIRCIRRDSTSNSGIILKSLGGSKDSVGAGIAFYVSQLPNASSLYRIIDFRDTNQEVQFSLFLESDGRITIRLSGNLSIIGMSRPGIVTSGEYTHIELAAIPDNDPLIEIGSFCGDIGSLEYDSLSKNISAQTVEAWDLSIKPDESKMMVHSKADERVYQYTISTPGDISSAIYDSVSFSISAQTNSPHGIFFRQSGTNFYISDDGDGSTGGVYQYSCSSWSLSSASYTLKKLNVPSGFVGFFDVTFSQDGSKLFALMHNGLAVGKIIKEYSLSTAWDISTASDTGRTLDVSSQLSDAHSIELLGDGQRLYVLSFIGNRLFQYNLSNKNNISTAVYSGSSFSVSSQNEESHGFSMSNDGNRLYVVDDTSDSIYQYSMECFVVDSNGFIELRVNGVTEISLSGAKTTTTDSKEYSYCAIIFGSSLSHGVQADIDDFYIWDTSGSWNNSFIGDRRCFLIKPNQDTNISDFDPSSGSFGYKMIDDDSPDDDSTYIIAEAYLQTGSPLSGTSEFYIESLPNGSSLISGVNVISRASKTDSTSAEIYTSINSGAHTSSGTSHTLTTSYAYYNDIYEYDPSTISSMTRSGFDPISVSVTAIDLDSGAVAESPDLEGSPTQEAFTPSDLFAGGQDGFWYDFSDTDTLWQDTAATSPVTASGQAIARVDDKAGNGYFALQAVAGFRPTYTESAGVAWSAYNADFITVASSLATLKWMHADTGLGIAILVRFGAVANPNTIYGIFGNSGGSASNRGVSFFWDDRASIPRNENGLFRISNGSGTYLYENIPGDGTLLANTDDNVIWNIPAGGTSDIYTEGSLIDSDTKTGTASTSNASFSLDIGAVGGATGSLALVGRIYQIIVRDSEFTSDEISQISSYFTSKL